MTLDKFRPLAERVLAPFVAAAIKLRLTPNVISVLAFFVAGAAGLTYYYAGSTEWLYLAGALLVLLNGWFDLLDGAVARELGTDSEAGDLLDHVLDRFADVVIIAGLAAGIGRWGLGFAAVTGVLLTSYLGTQAEAVGLDRVYGGLVGRADRLAVIGIVTALTPVLPGEPPELTAIGWLLVFLAVVGHITALQRFYYSMRAFE